MSSNSSSKNSPANSRPVSPQPELIGKATGNDQKSINEEKVEPARDNDDHDIGRAGRSSTLPQARAPRRSSSMIVPADQLTIDAQEAFDPDDARAMSPRRTSAECDEMSDTARLSVREYVTFSYRIQLNNQYKIFTLVYFTIQ